MTAKIVIASTLKPVWDPRAYEKIGQSLASTGLYEITIIGSGNAIVNSDKISFCAHEYPSGLLSRIITPVKVLRQLLLIRPQLLIITTHELIIPAILLKLFLRTKLVYDVQENYNYNLRYQGIYPPLISNPMAWYIRTKEVLFQAFFSLFILAEKCYLDEIGFLKRRVAKCLILENKCSRKFDKTDRHEDNKIELLLSGTISELYGALEAVEFYRKLPPDQFSLTIIGHCPSQGLRQRLNDKVKSLDGVKLQISEHPIPHEEIGSQYSKKTVGILPYRSNKSINNKVPTKLFEYLAHEIPVLVSPNPNWENYVLQYGKGRTIDFSQTTFSANKDIFNYLNKEDYNSDLESLMWKSSENKLFRAIKNILAI